MMFPSPHPFMLRCQTSPSMWRSAIACSADYTFISFEMVACYGRDRLALETPHVHLSWQTRSRYRESLYSILGSV
jgi:hypothetical protein